MAPYSEKRSFDADISSLWKSSDGDEAVKRLKRLCGCLVLRRPQDILDLPPRRDTRQTIQLSSEERQMYEDVRNRARMQVDEAFHRTDTSQAYDNVLQRIEAMRMICNIGLF